MWVVQAEFACIKFKCHSLVTIIHSYCCDLSSVFSLVGGFVPLHMGGGQVKGDKALMGGLMRGGHRPYGGDLTLIDYIIN